MPAKEASDNMSTAERVQTMEYLWSVLSSYYDSEVPEWHANVLVEREPPLRTNLRIGRPPRGSSVVYAVLDTRRNPVRNDDRLDESDDE